jgi:hypothetical protein
MVRAAFRLPAFTGQAVADGRRRRKPLKPRTVEWYGKIARAIEDDHPDFWSAIAARLNEDDAASLIDKIETRRGLSTARAARALLSSVWSKLKRQLKLGPNPFQGQRLPLPAPRLRIGEISEMRSLIAAADRLGLPEIGDAIMLGLVSAQRQNDRLLLERVAKTEDGRWLFRQSKTGAVVLLPFDAGLEARLEAARLRRQAMTVHWPHVIIDEAEGRPFDPLGDRYRKQFAKVRQAALAECPSLKDFRDQDLRDTAVTWLALAGCTIPEIGAITGHSEHSVHGIMKHYLGRHPDLARSAALKQMAWLKGKGGLQS